MVPPIGKLDYEDSSDDGEVELLMPGRVLMSAIRRGRISEMCQKRRVLSGRTGFRWSLCMELGRNGTGQDDPSGA